MFRFSNDQQSSRITINNNNSYSSIGQSHVSSKTNEKPIGLRLNQLSTDKSQRKGITTFLPHTIQQVSRDHVPEQRVVYSSRSSQTVYEQYLKTLQSEIASRQRQRVELHKSLEQVKKENSSFFYQLNQERKKNAALMMKMQQIQIFIKQNEQKKRIMSNQKQQIFKQYQFQTQRRKVLQVNDMKLRSHIQNIQVQYTSKSNQFMNNIKQLTEQNTRLKESIDKLQISLRSLQYSNEAYKKQLNETVVERNRVIDSLYGEKQSVETRVSQKQRQYEELLVVNDQQAQLIRQVNQKLADLQKASEHQKSQLRGQLNQVVSQNHSMKRNFELAKESFKKQMETLVFEGTRLRQVIGHFQKQKRADKSRIQDISRQLQSMTKQRNDITNKKSAVEQQLAGQKQSFLQQRVTLLGQIQQLQSRHGQKSQQLQQSLRALAELQSQLDLFRHKHTTQKQLLMGEMSFLKQQLSSQSSEYSVETTKFIQQREKLQLYYSDEISRLRIEAGERVKSEVNAVRREAEVKEKDLRASCEEVVGSLQAKVQELRKEREKMRRQHIANVERLNEEKQEAINKIIKKMNQHQQTTLLQHQAMQDRLNAQIVEKNRFINKSVILNSQIQRLSEQLLVLRKQLKETQDGYEIQKNQMKKRFEYCEREMKEQILSERKGFDSERNHMLNEALQVQSKLQQKISKLQAETQIFKRQRQNLVSTLNQSQQSLSKTIYQQKKDIEVLRKQKSELQSQIIAKQNQFKEKSEEYNSSTRQLRQRHNEQKRELENYIEGMLHSIVAVMDFAKISNGKGFNIDENTIQSHGKREVKEIYEGCRTGCQQITAFIGERLQNIHVLTQQNFQQKQQLQNLKLVISGLQKNIQDFTQQNLHLDKQRARTLAQLMELRRSLQQTNLQNNDSISRLRENIVSYKEKLSLYENEIKKLSSKVRQKQILLQNTENEKGHVTKQVQNCKQHIQKLMSNHSSETLQLQMNHKRQIDSICEQKQRQKESIRSECEYRISVLQKQCSQLKDRLKQAQKIIEKKNEQYEQLGNLFSLRTQRQNEEYASKVQQYERQMQALVARFSQLPNHEMLNKRIQLLENELSNKQKQLKILEDNNALLRKKFINSIAQQETLRQQIKQNKSQSSVSRSNSREVLRKDTSQELKRKYLKRRNSQNRSVQDQKQKNQLNLSLGQRSFSNSQIINSQLSNKRFQAPVGSQKKLSYLNANKRGNYDYGHAEAQRPMSNYERLAPNIPLQLKKIKEKGQKYFSSEVVSDQKIIRMRTEQNSECEISDDQSRRVLSPIRLYQKKNTLIERSNVQIPDSEQYDG